MSDEEDNDIDGQEDRKVCRGRTYAVMARLRLIDFLLHQYGYVNRSALMTFFGISSPQAAADFRAYMEIAPNNIYYDRSAKRYARLQTFRMAFP